ncbi:MAG TPA: carboxypeptidase-like regulatory domain-containing protein, partial [Pyrinomonadaceae bacterium]|nr:carboxypeptidase-like regulatory domain-containing protein [Pyrinomonadaceae bacterium]
MTHYRISPRRAAQLFALLFCFTASAVSLHAQNNKGTILGTITDPQGGLVSGAKVTAVNLATNTTAEDTTTEAGLYTLPNLDPGMYRVTIEAAGFRTVVNESVRLETNARLPIDAQLEVGAVGGDVVTVTDQGPLVESETSVRGDLITGREVTDLPIPQRNFTLLAALSPGVTRPNLGLLGGGGNFVAGGGGQNNTESTRFRESGGSVLVVNGARATNNNFRL